MNLAIVTGAGRRLGKSIAVYLAKNGFDVIVHYNQSKKGAEETASQIENLGRKAYILQADLTKVSEIELMFYNINQNFQKANVLVNNSGVFPESKKIQDISENDWNNIFDLNLKSVFFTSKEFAKMASKNSRIINISSIGGLEIWKERIPYNVSKSALIQLTKALSRELAPKISVNAVCPGQIIFDNNSKTNNQTYIDINKIPMGRFASPEDVAEAVYFFASATSYITGQYLIVDGGYHYSH